MAEKKKKVEMYGVRDYIIVSPYHTNVNLAGISFFFLGL